MGNFEAGSNPKPADRSVTVTFLSFLAIDTHAELRTLPDRVLLTTTKEDVPFLRIVVANDVEPALDASSLAGFAAVIPIEDVE